MVKFNLQSGRWAVLLSPALMSAATGFAAESGSAAPAQSKSLIDYFIAGGPLMYPILACSVVAAGVIIERVIRLRRDRIIDDATVKAVRDHLLHARKDDALQAASRDKKLCSHIMSRAIDDHMYTRASLEDALTEAGDRHIDSLSNWMRMLSIVIKIAPMLGLLGTVMGIIGAFANITGGEVVKEQMAKDIQVALITTFSGLAVAIPALIGEGFIRGIIRSRTNELEEIFISLIKANHIAAQGPAPEKPDAPATRTDEVLIADGDDNPGSLPQESPHAAV